MISVLYEDTAPGATDSMHVGATSVDIISNLARIPYGDASTMSVFSLEDNMFLSGRPAVPYPNGEDRDLILGYWSTTWSNQDCEFTVREVITINFDARYSSANMTFVFNPDTYDWCSEMEIAWYQNDMILAGPTTFNPNGVEWCCNNTVENFDKIQIAVIKTSKPFRRIRIQSIKLGSRTELTADVILSHSITFEVNPIGLTLPFGKFRVTISQSADISFLFQAMQPMRVYDVTETEGADSRLFIGTFYIDRVRRDKKSNYNLECIDALGVVGDWPYKPTMYETANARDIVNALFTDSFVLEWDPDLPNELWIEGYINANKLRAALAQIFFSLGVICVTMGTDHIRIMKSGTTAYRIPDDFIYANTKVTVDAAVTEVQLTAHSYSEIDSPDKARTGDDVVKWIDKTNEHNPDRYFMHTTKVLSKKTEGLADTAKPNVKEVRNCTLAYNEIAPELLATTYDYLSKRNTYEFDCVGLTFFQDNKSFNIVPGTMVSAITEYEMIVTGTIELMSLTLSSHTKTHLKVKYLEETDM